MPYIPQEERDHFKQHNLDWIMADADTDGKFNYVFSTMIRAWCDMEDHSYSTYARVLGNLDAIKLEFYRTVVAPYEDEKRKLNGDI